MPEREYLIHYDTDAGRSGVCRRRARSAAVARLEFLLAYPGRVAIWSVREVRSGLVLAQ